MPLVRRAGRRVSPKVELGKKTKRGNIAKKSPSQKILRRKLKERVKMMIEIDNNLRIKAKMRGRKKREGASRKGKF